MLESYVTPLLMSYVNKYIKNLKPSDLQLSLWGGDVVLSKLDLRLDVLEQVLPSVLTQLFLNLFSNVKARLSTSFAYVQWLDYIIHRLVETVDKPTVQLTSSSLFLIVFCFLLESFSV